MEQQQQQQTNAPSSPFLPLNADPNPQHQPSPQQPPHFIQERPEAPPTHLTPWLSREGPPRRLPIERLFSGSSREQRGGDLRQRIIPSEIIAHDSIGNTGRQRDVPFAEKNLEILDLSMQVEVNSDDLLIFDRPSTLVEEGNTSRDTIFSGTSCFKL